MRYILVFIAISFSTVVYSQSKFVYNENGLQPTHIISQVRTMSNSDLYEKTLEWIKTNYKNPDDSIADTLKNDFIHLTNIKENAINIGKQYFHVKYTIKISFENGYYTFEPLEIQSKLNSKYDMGWQTINLNDGDSFFKKGKVIKKTKSYVTDIPVIFNELNDSLNIYIFSD